MTLNMEHEFGHSHKLVIFCSNNKKNFYFDSPVVKIKLNKTDTITIDEGGDLFEYLLYNRIIEEMNIKEIIYILNLNNFKKDLDDYRNDFINLEKEKVIDVFNRECKDNKELSEFFEIYKKLPENVKKKLETTKFKSGKRISQGSQINFEKITFSGGKIRKPHNKNKRHRISKFNYDIDTDEKTNF